MQWYYLDANQQQVPADESELGTLLQSGTIAADTMVWNESLPEWVAARDLFPDWFPEASAPEPGPAPAVALRAPALSPRRTVGLVKRPLQTGTPATGAGSAGSRPQRTTGGSGASLRAGRGKRGGGEEAEESVEWVQSLADRLVAHSGWMKFVGVLLIINGVVACLTVVGAVIGWLPIWQGVVLNKAANAARGAADEGSREDLEEALERTGFFFKLTGIVILVLMIANIAAVVFTITSGLFAIVAGAAAGQPPAAPPGTP